MLFLSYRLGLKDQQEREIVHVLIDCCLQEKTYNPFYAFLAGKLCDYARSFQVTAGRQAACVPLSCLTTLADSAHLGCRP